MADAADVASEFEERARAAALARRPAPPTGPGSIYCLDCDEVIPWRRRKALPGVTLCVDCQQTAEAQSLHHSHPRREHL